ncbi:MAG: aminodeoxyfutalosine deaminase [Candidatus Krumholzibacteriia bacterium]|jgi:aminodeoxyfutalosine deaminase
MSRGRIELHTHLEGSVTPARLILLAEKYGLPNLPAACLNTAGDAYTFDGFLGFLNLYKIATSVMRSPADFHAIALDMGQQLAADNVRYAEISVSYGVLLWRDIDPLLIQIALHEAAEECRETLGVDMRWIPDAVRHWEIKNAWLAWEKAAMAGRDLGVVGFGLGGDEAKGPAAGFSKLFSQVKAEGYGVSIHAGEVTAMGDAARDSIRQAVEECGADRIGHGLAAASDPILLATLAARDIFVELCPGSNVLTGGVATFAEFPLAEFMIAGVPCSLNTDDRTMFNLTLTKEYDRATEELKLPAGTEDSMQKLAAQHAFAEVEE